MGYTECFYCEDGECKPGCTSDSDCPSTHPTCDSDHICNARPGKVLLKSITFVTDSLLAAPLRVWKLLLLGRRFLGFQMELPVTHRNLTTKELLTLPMEHPQHSMAK